MADVDAEAMLGDLPRAESVIIGLDFGTTYSKVVFARSSLPDDLTTVGDWPKSRTDNSRLGSTIVPTKVRYLANGEFEWGAQIPRDASHEACRLFKLALEPEMLQKATDAIGEVQLPANVDKIITDYMTGLWGHVVEFICEEFSCNKLKNVHVVLTVPAIWSDLSKQRTVQAFRNIPNLDKSVTVTLLSEPEAAAISALRDIDKSALEDDDTFVVIDAGGGTVDLITYTVTSLLPILEVHEATAGTGDFCGSSLINLRFEEFLTARLQNEPTWSTQALVSAQDRFENEVKRVFSLASLAENQVHNIPVAGLARNTDAGIIRANLFLLTSADIHMFFERHILRIIQLVREQIKMCNRPVRSIALVGGFGMSTYLRERIERAISDDTSIQAPVKILQPPNAWLAVARGAVMKGISQVMPEDYSIPTVKSRTARKHYGFELGVPYNSLEHASLASKRFWSAFSGLWYVRTMIWFIKTGDAVSEDFPFRKSYRYTSPVGTKRPRSYSLSIYADETSPTAPIGRSSNVKLLCRLSADLSSIPDEQLTKRLGVDGRMHYYVEFDIEAVYHSATTQYTIIHKGQRYDSVTAEYV